MIIKTVLLFFEEENRQKFFSDSLPLDLNDPQSTWKHLGTSELSPGSCHLADIFDHQIIIYG
jgi:hypothetical protein